MVDIILLIGVLMVLMEQRLYLTHLLLLEHSGMYVCVCSFGDVMYYSEPMWPVEARCAAIANTYIVGAINRVGTVSGIIIIRGLSSCSNIGDI